METLYLNTDLTSYIIKITTVCEKSCHLKVDYVWMEDCVGIRVSNGISGLYWLALVVEDGVIFLLFICFVICRVLHFWLEFLCILII